jgi:CRP-like cAMP-binding protein
MSVLSPARTDSGSLSRYVVTYPAGTRIYREGEVGTEMFTIRSGEVEITRTTNGETFTLARLRKGDFFGEMSLLEDMPREATASARTDVELVRVNGAVFEEMLRRNPEIALRMLRRLSRQAREATAFVEEVLGGRSLGAGKPPAATTGETAPGGRPAVLPQLVSADRKSRYVLNAEGDTVIGRSDPISGATPDVDLAPLDPQRSVSRRHARLYRIGDTTYVMEEIGVVNGTFVNETRLTTGAPAPLGHGDDLQLGLVTLTFWNPVA